MNEILTRFPKTRKPLPSAYQAIYEEHYKSNRNGEGAASGLAQKLESWLHKKVADDTLGLSGHKTLEIGAGTLNQIPYERDLSIMILSSHFPRSMQTPHTSNQCILFITI
ncbi:hypothetical protein [uncultured Helicobacter sp.]|uniref:hypothetical protein n=1 Tax=uncultured Helicobacter sp. TaxID=175537 RepID=UPI00258EAB2B|nr:hypothetical protein [uncultured Helicobacter sp.]